MSDHDVRCQEVVEILTDYLEDAMPTRQRIRLEQHLVICAACRTYLHQLRAAIELAGRTAQAHVDDPPPEVADSLLHLFRSWRSG